MLMKFLRTSYKFFSAKTTTIILAIASSFAFQCCVKANDAYELFEKDTPPWMLEQIQEDLSPFVEAGIRIEDLDKQMQLQEDLHLGLQLVRYKIANREVYVAGFPNSHPDYHARVLPVARFLQNLASLVDLPDVEFIMTTHDALDGQQLVSPVFAFAKNTKNAPKVVLMPDFEALLGYGKELGEVQRGNSAFPWENKVNKAFWRGAMTGGIYTPENFLSFPRANSVYLSFQFPNLIDSRFTILCQCEDCPQIRSTYPNYFTDFIPIYPQVAYKYQLLIDGNSCAYSRAYWQLFSNCLVLKQSSDAIQWYYRALQPYIHYIPVKTDMSDLVDVVQWAIDHDEQAEAISKEAQDFAHKNLSSIRIKQYVYHLLKEYAKLQR